jgi:hypothetical protein
MRTGRAVFVLLILCLPAYAANEPPPVAAIDNKAIEGGVTVDPKLKAYPALYRRLTAAGKTALAKWRGDAEHDLKTSPDMFTNGRRYSYWRSYQVRSIVGPYVSILQSEDTYSGGAHPNHVIDTLLWDAKAGGMISIRPFFREMATNGPTMRLLARRIRAAVAVEKRKRGIPVANPNSDEWLSTIKPKLTEIGGIALAPSTERGKSGGLIDYFSPYAVGSYAEGTYTVFVPWGAFKAHLSREGKALFGGERPPGDTDKD